MENFLLTILALIFVGCKQNNSSENQKKQTDIISSKLVVKKNPSEEILLKIIAKQKDVQKKLKSISKEEADKLYLNYTNEVNKLIIDLNSKEGGHYNYYFSEETNKPYDSVKLKLNLIKKANLELTFGEENSTEITNIKDFEYNLFYKYVTDKNKKYFEVSKKTLLIIQNNYTNLSAKKLGDVIIDWEILLKNHNYSTEFYKKVKEEYHNYQLLYILGEYYAPTIFEEKVIDYNMAEFERFINANPNSQTTRLINVFISKIGEKTEDNHQTDYSRLWDIIEKEQKK